MSNRTIDRAQLREVADALESLDPSRQLELRLGRSLHAGSTANTSSAPGFGWGFAFAAVAFVIGLAVGWWVLGTAAPEAEASQRPGIAAVDKGARCVVARSTAGPTQVPARCRVSFPEHGVEVDAWEPTVLRETKTGLRIDEGLAAFSVEKVDAGDPPVTVDVAAGTVRVIGTKFVIGNDTLAGHLDLIEGSVEFLHGKSVTAVEPGRRLSWTHARDGVPARIDVVDDEQASVESPPVSREADPGQEAADTAKQPAAEPKRPNGGSVDLSAVLSDVARHRRLGEYGQALARLEGVPKRGFSTETRAVLSYERGTLLEAAGRGGAACKHWMRHRQRYRGVGAKDVDARVASTCAD